MSLHKLVFRLSPCFVVLIFSAVVAHAQEKPPAPQPGAPGSAAPSTSPALKLREELIGEVAPGSKVEMARSTDNHLAWIEKKAATTL